MIKEITKEKKYYKNIKTTHTHDIIRYGGDDSDGGGYEVIELCCGDLCGKNKRGEDTEIKPLNISNVERKKVEFTEKVEFVKVPKVKRIKAFGKRKDEEEKKDEKIMPFGKRKEEK